MKDHDYLQFCNADALEQKGFPRTRSACAFLRGFWSRGKRKDEMLVAELCSIIMWGACAWRLYWPHEM